MVWRALLRVWRNISGVCVEVENTVTVSGRERNVWPKCRVV